MVTVPMVDEVKKRKKAETALSQGAQQMDEVA